METIKGVCKGSNKHTGTQFREDNEHEFVYSNMLPNLKVQRRACQDKSLAGSVRQKPVKYEAVTNIPGIFGTDWMIKVPDEIFSRGGALSMSSCTINGNVVGDYIIFMALQSYYGFFYPEIKGYFESAAGAEDKRFEEILEQCFQAVESYRGDLMTHRSRFIRKIYNFYYEDVAFMDTDMQHGLTRSESPDVIEFLRETSSGSQTEVAKILSLPDRELAYFKGMKQQLKKDHAAETDENAKAELQKQQDKIEDKLKTINGSIHVVNILEQIEGQ